MDELERKANENLYGFKKIVEFIKSLDDEGIETFIEVAKNEGSLIESEEELRKTLRRIRDDKGWD